MELVIIMRL